MKAAWAGRAAARSAAAAILLSLISAPPCHSQTSAQTAEQGAVTFFREMASVTAGASVQSWSVGGVRIAQQVYPMNVALPVAERALFTIAAVPASASQGGVAISGVPETRFGASYVLPGEKLWLTGAVSMPTGSTKLTAEQTVVAAALAQPALGFSMPLMGHGLNTTLGCAYASSVSRLIVFGFGAALSTKGRYEPVAPSGTSSMLYAPGNEVAANIGIDCRNGMKTDRLSADYTVTYYGADRLNGERFFQSGIRASLVVMGTHATRTLSHMAVLRLETRAQNVSTVDGGEMRTPSARRLSARYALTAALRERLALTAGAELRAMTSDEFPVAGGIIATGGGTVGVLSAGCSYAAASWCMLSPQASYGIGSVTSASRALHASGFEAGIGIKFSL